MNILIIDDVHELLTEGLVLDGHTVSYQPLWGKNEILAVIGNYDGLVVRSKMNFDKNVLSHAVKLKFIGRAGAGLDNIDIQYCATHGIKAFNAGEANADAVGEQTIAMLLGLFTNLVKADKEVRSGVWNREDNRGFELIGSVIGLIGYGNTGKAVARKLSGFGVKVLAYDKYLKDYSDEYAEESSMQNLFKEANIVSFHVPLTAETQHLGNSGFFDKFHQPIVVLNLSRGKVVNTLDLVDGLKSGKVIAAALDVLENEHLESLTKEEKMVFDYLTHSNQIILTPHIGGWTRESYKKISAVLLHKIRELASD